MLQPLWNAASATALIGVSSYLWRIAYKTSDWAVVALVPLAIALCISFWHLTIDPWRARLHIALREESYFSRIITGRLRAAILCVIFTASALILLAWQALSLPASEGPILLLSIFLSGCIFSFANQSLERHFHQPFARAIATSVVTWGVALPFALAFAQLTYSYAAIPGEMLHASFPEALQIGIDHLPERRGWIAEILAVPYAYEAAKLWAVIQLRDYRWLGRLFSLDAALFSFVVCHAGIVVTQFVETHVSRK